MVRHARSRRVDGMANLYRLLGQLGRVRVCGFEHEPDVRDRLPTLDEATGTAFAVATLLGGHVALCCCVCACALHLVPSVRGQTVGA
jgi:hypothetical protein